MTISIINFVGQHAEHMLYNKIE